ncbi:Glutathione synthase/glutaminyl transferase/alpha-L-glutamate ligase [Halanaeroarchaeum sp. HSR-CO]|uniref:ATP-grasp domain-containing protein n=1 Tax=Halanaeroarchaeum sp. HSR-CO TaxID=2866382 RepID=UPI00217E4518|nr:RimK family alpha-L-glutamate ligase [Halanaeroarchaeum sp. HSR-CO]UWG46951.1 Glutathione synthase/glutaminyl transferase/alpha-L-glutamate ligase [Halanaeroarchaeum sp. HSR-CO]
MVRLAVATRAQTFERIRGPLGDRGIDVESIATSERTVSLDDPPFDPARFDVGFVFPGRLMEGGVLSVLLSVPWINDREAVLRSRNKAETLARLQAADVPVPKTTLVSNPVDESATLDAFDNFDGPVVVKPNSTTRGRGVVRVDDPDSFRGVVDYLELLHDNQAVGDRSYLLQEFVPEATDYRVMVVDGAYAGAVERTIPDADRTAGRWKHNVHRGAVAETVDLPAELRAIAERVASVMDIPLLGVDLLVTDDRVVVTETNARPTVDSAEKYVSDFYDRLARLIRETAD